MSLYILASLSSFYFKLKNVIASRLLLTCYFLRHNSKPRNSFLPSLSRIQGGAMLVETFNKMEFNLQNCTFKNNTAVKGAAIYLNSNSRPNDAFIGNTTFDSNWAFRRPVSCILQFHYK
jgi:predicted outer membrane repeat protein